MQNLKTKLRWSLKSNQNQNQSNILGGFWSMYLSFLCLCFFSLSARKKGIQLVFVFGFWSKNCCRCCLLLSVAAVLLLLLVAAWNWLYLLCKWKKDLPFKDFFFGFMEKGCSFLCFWAREKGSLLRLFGWLENGCCIRSWLCFVVTL